MGTNQKGNTMNDAATDTATPTYEAGTWQATLNKSATLFDRSGKARKQASRLLWEGAQVAVEEWLDESDTDVHGENLYAGVLDILGTPRKGDASKIKAVALAVKNNGLVLSVYPNLSKAYAEATRLTKTVQQQADEDTAADEAVAQIDAPKSATTAENAALIVLAQGVDEAARLLLDALGATNTAAHRAFLRAISQEIAGRIQPAPKPAKKAAAPKPAKKAAAKKATAKSGAAKAKPAGTTAKKATAKPVAKKAAAPVEPEVEDVPEDMDEGVAAGDMFDEVDIDETEVEETVEEAAPAARPKPVRRGPVRRS